MDRPSISTVHVRTDTSFPLVLVVLFVAVYTQGYLERTGVPPSVVKTIVEMPVLVIMLHLINRGTWQPAPGFLLIVLYVVWSAVSAIFNGDSMYVAFLYCRYVVYAYVVFAAVWATPLRRSVVKRINSTIALLFVFQIMASVYQVLVQGERVEAYVGAVTARGGGLATALPLLAMGLTVPFYLYYRRNPLLLLLAWAFLLVGYASGKRAIYYLGPALYFFILGWYVARARALPALKRSLVGVLVFICLLPILWLGISRSPGIAQSHPGGLLDRVTYTLKAAEEYTTGERQTGRTTGRTSTNRRVLATLWNAPSGTILFGWGPAADRVRERERYESLMINYGICGWARDMICIGWPGVILYILFHLRVFYRCRSTAPPETGTYWPAMRFAGEIGFIVFLVVHLAYGSMYATTGVLSYVHLYVLALVMSPVHQRLRVAWC